MYQLPLEGRKTARSALPSPLKSPVEGMSPVRPHCWPYATPGRDRLDVPLAVGGSEDGQVGLAVAVEVAGDGDVAGQAPLRSRAGARDHPTVRMYHLPLEGRKTARSVMPSPS